MDGPPEPLEIGTAGSSSTRKPSLAVRLGPTTAGLSSGRPGGRSSLGSRRPTCRPIREPFSGRIAPKHGGEEIDHYEFGGVSRKRAGKGRSDS